MSLSMDEVEAQLNELHSLAEGIKSSLDVQTKEQAEQSGTMKAIQQLLKGAFGDDGLVKRVIALEKLVVDLNGRIALFTGVGIASSVVLPIIVSIIMAKFAGP